MEYTVEEIQAKLAEYAEYQHAIAVNEMAYKQARDEVIPSKVVLALLQVEAEFEGKAETAREKSNQLKAEITEAIKTLEGKDYQTIRAGGFMAVVKGGKATKEVDVKILLRGLDTLKKNYPPLAVEVDNVIQMATVETITNKSVAIQAER